MYTGIVLAIYVAVSTAITLAFAKTKTGKKVMNYIINKLTL